MVVPGRRPGGVLCKLLFNAALIAAALAITVAIPPGNGPVAIFAAPWSAGAAGIVAQAGGKLVRPGRAPWIIVAVSDDDGFVGKLYRAGAILVTDPRYAIGCDAERGQSR